MDPVFYIFLFFAGMVTGIFSGLLGIGGALIMIPILLYLPVPLGFKSISMHTITGIASMQTTFGTAASAIFHRKTGNVNYHLVFNVGIGIAIGALSGAVISKFLAELFLMWIYGLFLLVAAILLLIPHKESTLTVNEVRVSSYKSFIFGLIVGLVSGSLGFAGLVVITPLLNTLFDVPLKICISSGTHIAFVASLMSFVGKLITGQIEIISAVIISVSATIGAFIGTELNKKASPTVLKYILLVMILITLVKVFFDIVGSFSLG